jgi:hypothetical protein
VTNPRDTSPATAGVVLRFKPRAGGKRRQRGTRARYFYPREALEQPHFTVNGYGEKFPSPLGMSILTNEKFESQIALLLSQLTNEGFDVSGPEAEFRAMREVIRNASNKLDELEQWAMAWKHVWTQPSREYAGSSDES